MKYLIVKTDADTYVLCKDGYTYKRKGNFCGWYSSEYLLDCDILLIISTEEFDDYWSLKFMYKNVHMGEMYIESIYQSKQIEAPTDSEAIEVCKDFISDLLSGTRHWIE